MIQPVDAIRLIIAHADRSPAEAHYHLADPPLAHPRPIMEEAIFHIVDRNISLGQIGFDYYSNIVTYRV